MNTDLQTIRSSCQRRSTTESAAVGATVGAAGTAIVLAVMTAGHPVSMSTFLADVAIAVAGAGVAAGYIARALRNHNRKRHTSQLPKRDPLSILHTESA